ncbi:uncharacterized protein [Ptychodera flava]|uniref:uncharacterized protein n=1 Tax=Ptychodera flava TaxID=63121 RepID=UPI003969DC41
MMSFELNFSKSKINPQTLPTTKIRSLFPISEKIRRRAFVLNSQEHQRHEKFVSHMDLQQKIQGQKFRRTRRSLQADVENYEVYKRALYNIGKRQLELGLVKNVPTKHGSTRGAPRRLPPVAESLTESVVADEDGSKAKAEKSEKKQVVHEDKKKDEKEGGNEKKNREDVDEIKINSAGTGIMIVTAATEEDYIAPNEGYITDENRTEKDFVKKPQSDVDELLIDEVMVANTETRKEKIDAGARKRRRAKKKLTGDRYYERRTPKANVLPPFGIYNGKVYRHLSKERREAHSELDPVERRKRQAEALLENAHAQSSVLIDRNMPTSALLRSRDSCLKDRLKPSASLRLKPIKAKMRAVQAFMKIHEDVSVKADLNKSTDRFGRGLGLVTKRRASRDVGAIKTKKPAIV